MAVGGSPRITVPETYFSYRWHPYALDPTVDYSAEPTTLVEFFIEESEGGTDLRIVESGFDRIPLGRRDEAFRMNDGGWSGQIKNIERHVSWPRWVTRHDGLGSACLRRAG
jgi:hypothetical protein